jgi:hypothetical protein
MKKRRKTADTLWEIDIPFGSGFAELWYDSDFEEEDVCGVCGLGRFVKPDEIEAIWDEGSDEIGDFTDNVGFLIVARADIVDELLAQFSGFESVEVQFPDHPKRRRPKRVTKRTKRRVWLPYDGPPLKAIWITHHVDLHPSSTVEIEKACATCGSIVYDEFVGVAERIGEDVEPRQPNCGFFVSQDEMKQCDIFRPHWTGLTLCTDAFKGFVEARGWNNITFLDQGEILR